MKAKEQVVMSKNIAHYAFDVKVNNGSISNDNYEWIHFKKFQAFRIWIQN